MITLLVFVHLLLWSTLIGNLLYLRNTPGTGKRKGEKALVSVLVPARNEADNLTHLIPSVLSQTYERLQLIVYDDQSDDGTADSVARHLADGRLTYIKGCGPPVGWVGKVAALHAATRHARGDLLLFMDADARFLHDEALDRIVSLFLGLPSNSAVTALPSLKGKGMLLVSLVPFTTLAALPWFLVRRLSSPLVAALNGQLWMIRRTEYFELEPHEYARSQVLEDVHIGRYLKRSGVHPRLVDLTRDVSVRMYSNFPDAWEGFKKNAYLLMGGRPVPFLSFLVLFALCTWLSPIVSVYLLMSAWAIKLVSDRATGIHPAVSLGAPVSFMLGTFLHLDSAVAHWRGTVRWKGRNVSAD